MLDFQRENARFSLKWGISEEKTQDYRLNGGFSKIKCMIFALMRDFRVKWGICEEKTHDFRVKCGICKEKTRDFRLNGGFAKRKRDFCFNVVFAKR